MDGCRRQHRNARVPMLLIIPCEKAIEELVRVLKRSEAIGKLVVILQRSKLSFGERIVIAHVRAAVRARYADAIQHDSDRLCGHFRATIGMHDGLAGLNAFALERLSNEVLRERRLC